MPSIYLYSPGGNTTALVTGVPFGQRQAIAGVVGEAFPDVEQVGFVTRTGRTSASLAMAGGELCINAIRCAALWCFAGTRGARCQISVPGLRRSVRCRRSGSSVAVILPPSVYLRSRRTGSYDVVDLRGIRFAVVRSQLGAGLRKKIARSLTRTAPAAGTVAVSPVRGGVAIDPWVLVPGAGTYVRESACASGSLAVALALGRPSLRVRQPSGSWYRVSTERNGQGRAAAYGIAGPVRLLGCYELATYPARNFRT